MQAWLKSITPSCRNLACTMSTAHGRNRLESHLSKDFAGPTVPIGRNIPNVTQFILDENQQPVPIVCWWRAGNQQRDHPGYLNRPDLTKEKFVNWLNLSNT